MGQSYFFYFIEYSNDVPLEEASAFLRVPSWNLVPLIFYVSVARKTQRERKLEVLRGWRGRMRMMSLASPPRPPAPDSSFSTFLASSLPLPPSLSLSLTLFSLGERLALSRARLSTVDVELESLSSTASLLFSSPLLSSLLHRRSAISDVTAVAILFPSLSLSLSPFLYRFHLCY